MKCFSEVAVRSLMDWVADVSQGLPPSPCVVFSSSPLMTSVNQPKVIITREGYMTANIYVDLKRRGIYGSTQQGEAQEKEVVVKGTN